MHLQSANSLPYAPSPARAMAWALLLAASASYAASQVKHRFLAVDNGANRLLLFDQIGGEGWSIPIPAGSRDLQVLEGGKVLVSHGNGAAEYDLATGAMGWSLTGYSSITTASRLDNGNTLLGGNVDGVTLYEIGPDKLLKSKLNPEGLSDLRLARRLAGGNTLLGLAAPHKVVEIDGQGKTVWTGDLTDKGYVAYRLDDGHTLATSGEDFRIYDFDPDGKPTLIAGGRDRHPQARFLWFSGFQILPDGHLLVANWNGHGMEGQGPHAVEFDRSNTVVWTWEDHAVAATVTNVLSLERIPAYGTTGVRQAHGGVYSARLWRRLKDLLGRARE